MSYPLGVDIGTTYTAAALWRDGRVQTVPLGDRANAVPSVLFLRDDGTLLVGEAAARRGVTDPDRVARAVKRRMGDEVPILLGGQGFTAHQLTAEVLRQVVGRVSEVQGGPPGHVVLTHPASWGEFRRGLLVAAAAGTGLRDVGLLAEPVAAATWYAAQERVEPGSLIGIYDFGGGTFDASVVRKTETGMELFGEPGGDDSIGGVDFDHALFRRIAEVAGFDPAASVWDPVGTSALGQLFASVVEAKEALSADVEAVVPVVLPGVSQQVLITRAEFEDLIRQPVLGTVGVFGQVVRRAGVDPRALHAVLLVGGSSRIPLVRQLLAAELGIRVALDAHPKYTVSLGAAVAAAPRVTGPVWSSAPPGPARPMPPLIRPVPHPVVPVRPPMPRPVAPRPPVTGRPPVSPPRQPEPVPAPAVSEPVDLARTGLTQATDVQAVLAAIRPDIAALTPAPSPARSSTVVRTRERSQRSAAGPGRLLALGVVLAIAAVVVAIVLFVLPERGTGAGSAVPSGPAGQPGGQPEPPAGTLTLTGELVSLPDGPDAMRAAAALSSGGLVAVGLSNDTRPRAWLARGGPLMPARVDGGEHGQLSDVAALPSGGAVAVGFTGTGDGRQPAVWTSADGSSWRLLPSHGDFAPNSGVTELLTVTVYGPRNLLAIGKDFRADRTDGDGVVFDSTDGGDTWTRLAATGLDGPGPQTVQRVVRTGDGRFVAIGAALRGARLGPAIWTSPDGTGWQASVSLPAGAPTLYGIAQRADGRLISCGSVGAVDRPAVRCWIQNEQQGWESWDVTVAGGGPVPLYLYGLAAQGDAVRLVGVGKAGDTADSAVWTVQP